MKTLIVYYSLSGNTAKIAEDIASEIDADVYAIKAKNPIKAKGKAGQILAFMWRMITRNFNIESFDKNIDDYEEIIIGTPVWGGSYAAYIKKFFEQNPISGKKIHVFMSAGDNAGRTFENLKKLLADNEFGESFYLSDKEKDQKQRTEKTKQFAKKIKQI
ncbi:MAG: flavodoxin family protein [Candidatus Zixiibacteriota bacterium]